MSFFWRATWWKSWWSGVCSPPNNSGSGWNVINVGRDSLNLSALNKQTGFSAHVVPSVPLLHFVRPWWNIEYVLVPLWHIYHKVKQVMNSWNALSNGTYSARPSCTVVAWRFLCSSIRKKRLFLFYVEFVLSTHFVDSLTVAYGPNTMCSSAGIIQFQPYSLLAGNSSVRQFTP